jgi:hypothetical protein
MYLLLQYAVLGWLGCAHLLLQYAVRGQQI